MCFVDLIFFLFHNRKKNIERTLSFLQAIVWEGLNWHAKITEPQLLQDGLEGCSHHSQPWLTLIGLMLRSLLFLLQFFSLHFPWFSWSPLLTYRVLSFYSILCILQYLYIPQFLLASCYTFRVLWSGSKCCIFIVFRSHPSYSYWH